MISMGKIISTEKLSLNGDNIRLGSSEQNKFEVTDAQGNILISKDSIEASISSLSAQIEENEFATVQVALTEGQSTVTVPFGKTFSFAPQVAASILGGGSSAIMAAQLTSVSLTEASFQLTDEVAAGEAYIMQMVALSSSVAPEATSIDTESAIGERTGDPQGTIFFSSDTSKFLIYTGSSWITFSAA